MSMTLEIEGMGDPVAVPVSLESLLGPAHGRYFGAGYRAVRYSWESAVRGAGSQVEAVGRVVYPATWSTASDGFVRQPHLSSVDAVVLPLLVLERGAPPRQRQALDGLYVTSIDLRAGASPWLELDAVPVGYTVEATEAQCHLMGVSGNIRFNTTLSAAAARPTRDEPPSSPGRPSVYGGLFQNTRTRSTVSDLDLTEGELRGSHLFDTDDLLTPGPGIGASQWPAPTVIDYLVTMGQLTQALVYESAGTTRSKAGPLWMRTMTIEIVEPPTRLPMAFDTTTRVVRDRIVERGGERIHDVLVESSATSGVRARSTLAYKEPST
ncbi:AvrD family protein [Microbacterium lacticum]